MGSESDRMGLNLSLDTGRFFCLQCAPFSLQPRVPHPSPYTLCYIYTDPITSVPSSAHLTPGLLQWRSQSKLVQLDQSSAPNHPWIPISRRGKAKGPTMTHQGHWPLDCSLNPEHTPVSGHKAYQPLCQSGESSSVRGKTSKQTIQVSRAHMGLKGPEHKRVFCTRNGRRPVV